MSRMRIIPERGGADDLGVGECSQQADREAIVFTKAGDLVSSGAVRDLVRYDPVEGLDEVRAHVGPASGLREDQVASKQTSQTQGQKSAPRHRLPIEQGDQRLHGRFALPCEKEVAVFHREGRLEVGHEFGPLLIDPLPEFHDRVCFPGFHTSEPRAAMGHAADHHQAGGID